MSCADANEILFRIKKNKTELPQVVVAELIETVKESVPGCKFYWDAND
jgi:hypothetical protein